MTECRFEHDTGRSALWNLCILVAIVATTLVGPKANAAEREIRFKVIDGKLCARCTLHSPAVSIPGNVTIDLGSRVPLLVHERAAKLLKVGSGNRLELRFDNLVLSNLPSTPKSLGSLDKLTRDHAAELGEIPAVAVLGLPALADFSLQLEVGEGVLRLLPAAEPSEPRDVSATGIEQPESKTSSFTYKEQGHSYWLDGIGPDEFPLRVRFATSDTDTLIDEMVTDLLGAPGGELDELHIGSVNVARYVAPRPWDLSAISEPRPDVILGTNLLKHFRVSIDPVNRRMRFEQTAPPCFPAEERAYFIADTNEDADAIESFLTQHPSSRLAPEAAAQLYRLRLDEYPPAPDAIARAIRLRAVSAREDRRAGNMLILADELIGGSRDDKYKLAEKVLDVGLKYAPRGLNGNESHHLHARMGLVALRRGDLKQARRHLLSAAFGLPRDPLVNLWLGELYERMGKLARAWSRYLQATLAKDAPQEALEGLDRLNRNPTFRGSFTMTDAEQLLEGRMLEFHPATRYRRDPKAETEQPVRLVELFTCIDDPGTLAAELAFGGLGEYFDRAGVALIEYHVSKPQADPLTSDISEARRGFYGVDHVPTALFDGGNPNANAGGFGEVDRVFSEYVAAALNSSADAAWSLTGTASVSGDEITGTLELVGPEGDTDLRLHVILCEKAVMASGANGLVLHRYVARGAVSPVEGFAVSAKAGTRAFEIKVRPAAVGKALEQTIATLEKDRQIAFIMKPTYVDAGSSVVVAFLQRSSSKLVLAACGLNVMPVE